MKKFVLSFIIILLSFSLFFVGCSTYNAKNLANDIDISMNNFVNAIYNLDWPSDEDLDTLDNVCYIERDDTAIDDIQKVTDTDIDTTELYNWIDRIKNKINILFSKKSDLYLYIDEINSDNTDLNESNLQSIKIYINIIKDNSNYLTGYSGMFTTQLNQAINIINSQNNLNLINAYVIRAVETLQIRSAKIDTTILAINSIVDIINNHLIDNHYNYNLFNTNYNNEDDIQNDKIDEDNNEDENYDINENIDNSQQDENETNNNESTNPNLDNESNTESNNQFKVENDDDIVEVENNTKIPPVEKYEPEINVDEEINHDEIEKDENLFDEIETLLPNDKPITREIYKEKIV